MTVNHSSCASMNLKRTQWVPNHKRYWAQIKFLKYYTVIAL